MQIECWNQLDDRRAIDVVRPCVAILDWSEKLVAGRPFRNRDALFETAMTLMLDWDEACLDEAMQAHPKIGQKVQSDDAQSEFSKKEQSSVGDAQAVALAEGNRRYEQRFGRVFLIRAKGRSGEQILHELERRMQLSEAEELYEALHALREITLLRLQEIIEP